MFVKGYVRVSTTNISMYYIYSNRSRDHINTWAQINARVQHSRTKGNKRLCKIYSDKYSMYIIHFVAIYTD